MELNFEIFSKGCEYEDLPFCDHPSRQVKFNPLKNPICRKEACPIWKKPKPPIGRIYKEGTDTCPKCSSSLVRKWFKIVGCLQPECENYYKKE